MKASVRVCVVCMWLKVELMDELCFYLNTYTMRLLFHCMAFILVCIYDFYLFIQQELYW